MRAAFERHRIAATEAHELGGAIALGHREAGHVEAGADREQPGIVVEPAMDADGDAEAAGERRLLLGAREGFELAAIVLRPEEDEGLALTAEGVDVEQRIVLAQQRAERVADPVLVIVGEGLLAQVAVEVAVALACLLPKGLGIGDRHEGDLAAQDLEPPGAAILDGAQDRGGAAGLVAVNGAEHDQLRARFQAGEAHAFERPVVEVDGSQGRSLVLSGWPITQAPRRAGSVPRARARSRRGAALEAAGRCRGPRGSAGGSGSPMAAPAGSAVHRRS